MSIDLSSIPDTDVGRDARLSAACMYESTGDKVMAALAGGVQADTFDSWLAADWWPVAAEAARLSFDTEIKGRLANAARKAMEKLDERIEHGDEQLDRNGNIHTVAVSAKDLAVIAAVSIDKRQLVAGKPTSIAGGIKREELLAALRGQAKAPGLVPEAPPPAAPSMSVGATPPPPPPSSTLH